MVYKFCRIINFRKLHESANSPEKISLRVQHKLELTLVFQNVTHLYSRIYYISYQSNN